MPSIIVTCNRCAEKINGYMNEFGTSGFYRVDKPGWQIYQRENEKIICDNCMHNDLNYRKNFVWIK